MPAHTQGRQGRSLPIRPTLVGIFTVPLISLVLLWAFAAVTSITNATHAHGYQAIAPRVQPVLAALAQEREESYIWLATAGRSPRVRLESSRAQTTGAAAAARSALDSVLAQYTPLAAVQLSSFLGQLGQLDAIRAKVDAKAITPAASFAAYNGVV